MSREIRIYPDHYAENPFEAWDQVSTVVYTSTGYTLGSLHVSNYEDFLIDKLHEAGHEEHDDEGYEVIGDLSLDELFDRFSRYYWYWPVYAYIHGMATVSMGPFSCPWDSGQSGFSFISKETHPDEAQARQIAKNELEVFDHWLRGNCYRFEVFEDGEWADSGCGFYGNDFENNGLLELAGDAGDVDRVYLMREETATRWVIDEELAELAA